MAMTAANTRQAAENSPPEAGAVILTLVGLGVSFRTDAGPRTVLADVNLQVRAGEFVCIVGPSGAGKTTLIRVISGLAQPSVGAAELDGAVITEPPRRLALVSQDYSHSLMPWLRVVENVRLPLRGKGVGKREMAERARHALESVGLSGAARAYPAQLSGGMQQRVSIARALAYQPEILVMDEPFASVDAQTRADLEDLILRLQRESGLTVLLVTHDIDEAVYLSDRVVALGGSPATILREVAIDLGRGRDQLTTKARPEFVAYRSEVLACVRAARATAERG